MAGEAAVTGADIGLAAVQQGGDFLSQLFFNKRQQRQIKEAEQRSNAEWDRRFAAENAYNAPSAQAERLKAAGINPVGALSGNSPTPAASGSTNQPQAPEKMSMPDRIGLAELNLQAKRLENETLVSQAEANKLNADADRARGLEKRDEEKQPYILRDMDDEHRQNLAKETILNVEATYSEDYWTLTLQQQSASIGKTIWETAKTVTDIEKVNQDIEESISRVALNESMEKKNYSDIDMNNSDMRLNTAKIHELNQKVISMKNADFIAYWKAEQGQELTDAQVDDLRNKAQVYEAEANKINKEAKWTGAREIANIVRSVGSAAADCGQAYASVMTGGLSELTTTRTIVEEKQYGAFGKEKGTKTTETVVQSKK